MKTALIQKINDEYVVLLDQSTLEAVGLDSNAYVDFAVRDGSIVISPVKPQAIESARFEASLEEVIRTQGDVLRRLAE